LRLTFLGALYHKGMFIFLKSTKNSAFIDTYKSLIVTKFFEPHIVNDLKSYDSAEEAGGQKLFPDNFYFE
jgi:hypothetical protein